MRAARRTNQGEIMNDGYEKCAYCRWVGKLRKGGKLRKHRESVDAGHITMSGGMKQQTNGPICKGSGQEPWDWTPPEGGYVIRLSGKAHSSESAWR